MSKVPKFVRQRLEKQAAGEHPDANVLAAFAEDALSGHDRAQVLGHLSACAACREVVSLALPEIPATTPVAVPGGTKWSRWPMLRWAGIAAAVVVVAAAVVVQNSRRVEPTAQFARTESVVKPAETKQPESTASGPQTPEVIDDRAKRESRAFRDSERAKAEIRTDKKKDANAGIVANANGAPARQEIQVAQNNEPAQSQVQNQSLAMPAAPAAKVQAYSNANAAAPASGVVAMEQSKQQAAQSASQVARANDADEVTAQYDAVTAQKAKAKGGEQVALDRRANARTASAPKPVDAIGGAMMKEAISATPHWRVSTEGTLERSTDAGRTWQFVRVGAAATTFRSFSSVGRELWAGGTGGVLYHSPDNGRTWQSVTVKAGEVTLESDITRVEFTDFQHGTLTTTAGETWATADGGATWSVRR